MMNTEGGSRGPFARSGRFFWRDVLWGMLAPRRVRRTRLTKAGMIFLCLMVLTAAGAYWMADNVLYLALASEIAVLFLNGVMARLNLRALGWRLEVDSPLRVAQEATVRVQLLNAKRVLPAMGLSVKMEGLEQLGGTVSIGPQTRVELTWQTRPARRGLAAITLGEVVSTFPFGLVEKAVPVNLSRAVVVWPSPVAYRYVEKWQHGRPHAGIAQRHAGVGDDFFGIRPYAVGDAPASIYWKASARAGQLLVRQYATESRVGVTLCFSSGDDPWRGKDAQFELMCSMASTMAEDLFADGQMVAVQVNDGPRITLKKWPDLAAFMDAVALSEITPGFSAAWRPGVINFAPHGAHGVIAYVDGETVAEA